MTTRWEGTVSSEVARLMRCCSRRGIQDISLAVNFHLVYSAGLTLAASSSEGLVNGESPDIRYQMEGANPVDCLVGQGSGVFRTYGGSSGMHGCGAESHSCEHGHATLIM
jgi:hypothetical protein